MSMLEPATKQDLYETEARIGQILKQLAEVQLHTTEHIERLTVRLDRIAETQQQQGEALQRLTEAQQRQTEAQQRLTENQQHGDERLNALIAIVDELIRRPPAP